MSRAVTIASIIDRVRWRADIESQTARHTDASLLVEINRSAADLRERMSNSGSGLFIAWTAGTTGIGVTAPYTWRVLSLPTAAIRILAFDLTVSATDIRSLEAISIEQRNSIGTPFQGQLTGTPIGFFPVNWSTGTAPGYVAQIALCPAPDRDYSYSIGYLSAWVDVASGDTIDCIDGFDDYIVLDVARKVCERENDMANAAALLDVDLQRAWTQRIEPACRVQRVTPGRRIDASGQRRMSRIDPFRRAL